MAGGDGPARPLRADARRNRDRLLHAAAAAFAAEGLSVPLDEIARRAGVGPGTLYRHFPTKEALFEAVLHDRLQRLADDARGLREVPDAGRALLGFIDRLGAKGMPQRGQARPRRRAGHLRHRPERRAGRPGGPAPRGDRPVARPRSARRRHPRRHHHRRPDGAHPGHPGRRQGRARRRRRSGPRRSGAVRRAAGLERPVHAGRSCYERRLLSPVRISLIRTPGCSSAAKCPPLSASP
jgi:AcrR family transcriptional regulator